MIRIFEIRTMNFDKYGNMRIVTVMDLETYNETLANYIEHVKDESFNNGFAAGQDPYPTEEELEEMEGKE